MIRSNYSFIIHLCSFLFSILLISGKREREREVATSFNIYNGKHFAKSQNRGEKYLSPWFYVEKNYNRFNGSIDRYLSPPDFVDIYKRKGDRWKDDFETPFVTFWTNDIDSRVWQKNSSFKKVSRIRHAPIGSTIVTRRLLSYLRLDVFREENRDASSIADEFNKGHWLSRSIKTWSILANFSVFFFRSIRESRKLRFYFLPISLMERRFFVFDKYPLWLV